MYIIHFQLVKENIAHYAEVMDAVRSVEETMKSIQRVIANVSHANMKYIFALLLNIGPCSLI